MDQIYGVIYWKDEAGEDHFIACESQGLAKKAHKQAADSYLGSTVYLCMVVQSAESGVETVFEDIQHEQTREPTTKLREADRPQAQLYDESESHDQD